MKKQYIKEIICLALLGIKKIMEKLNRAQKCSNLGPQNLGSKGDPGPPLDPLLKLFCNYHKCLENISHLINYIICNKNI